MRGPIGSKVRLTIKRGITLQKDIDLERIKIISDAELEVERIENVLIIRLSSIPSGIAETLKRMTADLLPMSKGIILDLRNNSGGLLDESISLADEFLDKAIIVTSRGRTDRDVERWWARKGQIASGLPIVVLVNATTASGAEVIAGALQDNGRATIVGQKTFGAGSVQSLILIDQDHVLKLTTSNEYRPNGERLTDAPIIPDCVTGLKRDDLLKFALAIVKQAGKRLCPTTSDGASK